MKKLAGAIGVILIVLVGVVVFGPGLIDWNSHTDRIARQIEKVSGRKVSIAGPIDVQVLPSPVLFISGIKLANIDGSKDPYMASLESLEVRVAAAPLLAGRVQVETIKLVKPVVLLERLPGGQVNWDFAHSSDQANEHASLAPETGSEAAGLVAKSEPASDAARTSIASSIGIDSFLVEDGRINYRDLQRGRSESITSIDGRVAAVSLNGPIESAGAFNVRGRQVAYSLNVAEIIRGRTVPLVFGLNLGNDTTFKIDGSVVDLAEQPRLRAKLTGGGGNIGKALSILLGSSEGSVNLAKSFSIDGDIEVDVDGGELQEIKVKVGDTELTVNGNLVASEKPLVDLQLKSGWIDMDAWLPVLARIDQPAPTSPIKPDAGKSTKTESTVLSNAPTDKPENAKLIELPTAFHATLGVRIESLIYQGKPIQAIDLSAELANGELTLNQFTAQLPGDADIGVFGFLGSKDGKLRFDGEFQSQAKDLAPIVAWLAPEVAVSEGNLKGFEFKTPVVIDQNFAHLTAIKAKAGKSNLTGAVTFALQKRPSFGANFEIDRLNADHWLGGSASNKAMSKPDPKTAVEGNPNGSSSIKPGSRKSSVVPVNPLASLVALAGFDANFKLTVGRATYLGHSLQKFDLDATLQQGNLTLRELSIGRFAGIGGRLTGGLEGFDGVPSAKNLEFSANANDLGPIAKMLGVELPVPSKSLGAVSLDATVNGGLLAPSMKVTAKAMGGAISAQGTLPILVLAGTDVNLAVSMKHGNLKSLITRLGSGYRPQGKLGGIDLKGTLVGDLKTMRFDNLAGQVAGIQTIGSVSIALGGVRPKAIANLNLSPIAIDPFLPAKRAALYRPKGWGVDRTPVAWLGPIKNELIQSAAISRRWSKDVFDLSVLSTVDAALTLTTPRLSYEGTALKNMNMGAALEAGTLSIERLTGNLFGGALDAKLRLANDGAVSAVGNVANLNLARAKPITGSRKAAGIVNADFELTAHGASEAAIMSTLSGRLNFTGKDLNSEALSNPEAGFGLGGVALALNQLGGALGGPKKGGGVADVEANFTVQSGVATPTVLKAVTNVGVASGGGSVDLAAWTVNLSGAIQPAPSLLSAAFSIATRKGINVPFSVTGDLDKPRIRIDTASLGTGGLPIPGLDRLLNNKGVGSVLQGILGGSQKSAPTQTEPQSSGTEPPSQGSAPPSQQPTPQQQPAPQQVKPADILRGLLNKL